MARIVEKRPKLGTNDEQVRLLAYEQRTLAEMIACEEELVACGVPRDQCELTAQLGKRSTAATLQALEQLALAQGPVRSAGVGRCRRAGAGERRCASCHVRAMQRQTAIGTYPPIVGL